MNTIEGKIKWQKTVTRPLTLLRATTHLRGLDEGLFEVIGVRLKNILIQPVDGDNHAWWFDEREFGMFVKRVSDLCIDLNTLRSELRKFLEVCEEMKQSFNSIRTETLGKKSLAELYTILKKYHETFDRHAFLLWGMLVIERNLYSRIRKRLEILLGQRNKINRFSEYLKILTTKISLIDAEKENQELLEIKARSLKEGLSSEEISKLLDDHVKKFAWLPMYDHNLEIWDKEYFFEKILSLLDTPEEIEEILDKKKRNLEKARENIEKILTELNDGELTTLVKILQDCLILRTLRTDIIRIACYSLDPLLQQIAEKLEWSKDLICYLTMEELLKYLSDGALPNKSEVEERKRIYLFLKINDNQRILTDEKEIQELLIKEVPEAVKAETVLKGEGVYEGVVRGRVRIVTSSKDDWKVEKGNIIVTTMTTPDMHRMIEKAAAIVTDEGGITCHATIVARELEIPCVIGTEFATRLLKDGDLIEVNSKEGIVKKLEI